MKFQNVLVLADGSESFGRIWTGVNAQKIAQDACDEANKTFEANDMAFRCETRKVITEPLFHLTTKNFMEFFKANPQLDGKIVLMREDGSEEVRYYVLCPVAAFDDHLALAFCNWENMDDVKFKNDAPNMPTAVTYISRRIMSLMTSNNPHCSTDFYIFNSYSAVSEFIQEEKG